MSTLALLHLNNGSSNHREDGHSYELALVESRPLLSI